MRFFVGHDNRIVLPLSAVSGAAFVVVCDLLARVLFAPYEVPVGILMAFLGGLLHLPHFEEQEGKP